jgi:hypothetical protein
MILIASFLVSIAIVLARGGDIRRIADLPVRKGWIALIAFGLQIYVIFFPEPRAEGLFSFPVALLCLSYVLAFVFVWKNRSLPGIWVAATGLAANFSVMLLNGGYMPINAEALGRVGHSRNILSSGPGARIAGTKDIVLPREATIAWWLSDIFVLPPPFPIPSVFSLGDFFIAAGIFWLIQSAALHPVSPKNK